MIYQLNFIIKKRKKENVIEDQKSTKRASIGRSAT